MTTKTAEITKTTNAVEETEMTETIETAGEKKMTEIDAAEMTGIGAAETIGEKEITGIEAAVAKNQPAGDPKGCCIFR